MTDRVESGYTNDDHLKLLEKIIDFYPALIENGNFSNIDSKIDRMYAGLPYR